MIRITIQAPQWAIDAGYAKPGDTDQMLFEENEVEKMEEFKKSGMNPIVEYVNADNDTEMFVCNYDH